MKDFRPLNLEQILDRIDATKNDARRVQIAARKAAQRADDLKDSDFARINSELTNEGKLAAGAWILNKSVAEIAKKE